MKIGLLGRKVGMTRVFTPEGVSLPVSVVEVQPNRVSQLRTEGVDGYTAVQLTAGSKKASRVNKAEAGHFAKASVEAGDMVREFRL
jgi:large subunit ribosomal protein L3